VLFLVEHRARLLGLIEPCGGFGKMGQRSRLREASPDGASFGGRKGRFDVLPACGRHARIGARHAQHGHARQPALAATVGKSIGQSEQRLHRMVNRGIDGFPARRFAGGQPAGQGTRFLQTAGRRLAGETFPYRIGG
jgi:hypothetical protein